MPAASEDLTGRRQVRWKRKEKDRKEKKEKKGEMQAQRGRGVGGREGKETKRRATEKTLDATRRPQPRETRSVNDSETCTQRGESVVIERNKKNDRSKRAVSCRNHHCSYPVVTLALEMTVSFVATFADVSWRATMFSGGLGQLP